jgi:hypothetical protein
VFDLLVAAKSECAFRDINFFGDGKTSTLLSQPTFYGSAFLKAKDNANLRQKLDLIDLYL